MTASPLDSDRSLKHLLSIATDATTPTRRCPARLARSPHPQDALAVGDARLGHQSAGATDVRRRVRDESGLSLSRPPASRERRPDYERMGGDRQQPPGSLLPDHG